MQGEEVSTFRPELLGELLLERGCLNETDLEKALEIQRNVGGRLGAVLTRTGSISEDNLLEALSDQLGFSLLGADIPLPDDLACYDFMYRSEIQFDWFLEQQVILWPLDESTFGCIARDPLDVRVRETLEHFYPESQPIYYLARGHDIDRLLDFIGRESAVESLFREDASAKALKELAEEAPVIELVSNVISQGVDANASDIHIEPGDDLFHVRFRVDGVLYNRLSQPMERFAAISSRIKLISGIDISERRLPQDGRMSMRVSGREMDIRVSTVPEVKGESIVLRLLPKERDDLSLKNLGLEKDHLARLQGWAHDSGGVVLVTGPTGSGKSTTLHAMLQEANDGERKLITVEDPVEVRVKGVTQIQAHADIGYTFATALRAILRQDPDVIMIGEIRDLETAEIAIQSALTGHLVLSTIHTNDAVSVFSRLVDMGVEPFLVASPIKGVQAQRLIRLVCNHCSESFSPPEEVRSELLSLTLPDALGEDWKKAVGCARCHGTGYSGRMGIYEVVPMDVQMQALISGGATTEKIRDYAQGIGCRTLRQDGLIKAARGLTTIEEVLRVVGQES